MGQVKDDFLQVLPLMPAHRLQSKRSRTLHLDELIDTHRSQGALSGGALDILLSAYRLTHVFEEKLFAFRDKPLKPALLKDLLQAAFAAVILRDKIPASALVSEAVEAARVGYGDFATGIVNAFLRQVVREKDATLAALQQRPEKLLGPVLQKRWAKEPVLLKRLGEQLLIRPESGIWSFDGEGKFERRPIESFQTQKLQAMDPGSWMLTQKVFECALPLLRSIKGVKSLDACAAPGGKLIAWELALGRERLEHETFATDASFPRLEILRRNLKRWAIEGRVKSGIYAWGGADPSAKVDELAAAEYPAGWPENFDIIWADLPCTGSGTLHTQPDLLLADLTERLKAVQPLQKRILKDLRKKLTPEGQLFVSLCSVDPAERDAISKEVGSQPFAFSFDLSGEPCEGLYAWRVTMGKV